MTVVRDGGAGAWPGIGTRVLNTGYHVVSTSRREPTDFRWEHIEVDLLNPRNALQAGWEFAEHHAITSGPAASAPAEPCSSMATPV